MSFDIFLQKFSDGQPAEANREAVLAVLKSADFNGPDKFGIHRVKFPDGVDAEFSAKELYDAGEFNACAFHMHGNSPHLSKFIFEIAKAGDMVILPAMEDFIPILSSSLQKEHLPQELAENEPPPIVCESSEELEFLLNGGYEGWRKYRDQIISGNGER
jgi:hypothetical protein